MTLGDSKLKIRQKSTKRKEQFNQNKAPTLGIFGKHTTISEAATKKGVSPRGSQSVILDEQLNPIQTKTDKVIKDEILEEDLSNANV